MERVTTKIASDTLPRYLSSVHFHTESPRIYWFASRCTPLQMFRFSCKWRGPTSSFFSCFLFLFLIVIHESHIQSPRHWRHLTEQFTGDLVFSRSLRKYFTSDYSLIWPYQTQLSLNCFFTLPDDNLLIRYQATISFTDIVSCVDSSEVLLLPNNPAGHISKHHVCRWYRREDLLYPPRFQLFTFTRLQK